MGVQSGGFVICREWLEWTQSYRLIATNGVAFVACRRQSFPRDGDGEGNESPETTGGLAGGLAGPVVSSTTGNRDGTGCLRQFLTSGRPGIPDHGKR